jgi:hypothetical protein
MGDFNGTGFVDLNDYATWFNNFNVNENAFNAAAPEPATLAMLALGGSAMARRRRG